MSSFPGSPHLIKGGIILIDADTATIQKIITLQYNPDTLTRSLQVKGVGESSGNKSEAMRLSGPPIETIKVEVELDATDQLEVADSTTTQTGIQPQLSILETIVYPSSTQLINNNNSAQSGTLEIIPMETSLSLFIWNKNRIIPMRLTEFNITEEAFDVNLNPIRAKISLGMRVLSVDDLGFNTAGSLYMNYQQNKEQLASKFRQGSLADLGINSIS
ncbi:MAG: CIS tube protein [Flavisolibacter sp.]